MKLNNLEIFYTMVCRLKGHTLTQFEPYFTLNAYGSCTRCGAVQKMEEPIIDLTDEVKCQHPWFVGSDKYPMCAVCYAEPMEEIQNVDKAN